MISTRMDEVRSSFNADLFIFLKPKVKASINVAILNIPICTCVWEASVCLSVFLLIKQQPVEGNGTNSTRLQCCVLLCTDSLRR